MNYRYVLRQLGALLITLSVVLLGMGVWALLRLWTGLTADHPAIWSLYVSGSAGALVGLGMVLLNRKASRVMGRREALLLVALSWIVGAALAALPYLLWAHLHAENPDHPFRNFVNCYFESISGLTTTGATILGSQAPNDIESLPASLLFWRSLTQWLGGIGIVVLFVAVLPSLGVGGKRLYRVEVSGPAPTGLQPQIRETARTLFMIYIALTIAEVLALKLAGLGWFDAFCHTFTTLATGGFSTRNASVGAYASPTVYAIFIVFMLLGGVNFGLYFQLIRRKTGHLRRDPELRLYLALLTLGSFLVFLSLTGHPIVATTGQTVDAGRPEEALEAVFAVVSVQTTTGYCTSDFNLWPFLAQGTLVLLMFAGGCSGSTAGGVKVIRLWIAFKIMLAEIERVFRPNVIRPVRVAGGKVDPDLQLGTLAWLLGIVLLFVAGSAAVMLLERNNVQPCDYRTAATASIASLFTIGPGLGGVGPVENYGWLSNSSKLVLCLLMTLGRLEVFAIIVLFSRRFWRGD